MRRIGDVEQAIVQPVVVVQQRPGALVRHAAGEPVEHRRHRRARLRLLRPAERGLQRRVQPDSWRWRKPSTRPRSPKPISRGSTRCRSARASTSAKPMRRLSSGRPANSAGKSSRMTKPTRRSSTMNTAPTMLSSSRQQQASRGELVDAGSAPTAPGARGACRAHQAGSAPKAGGATRIPGPTRLRQSAAGRSGWPCRRGTARPTADPRRRAGARADQGSSRKMSRRSSGLSAINSAAAKVGVDCMGALASGGSWGALQDVAAGLLRRIAVIATRGYDVGDKVIALNAPVIWAIPFRKRAEALNAPFRSTFPLNVVSKSRDIFKPDFPRSIRSKDSARPREARCSRP